MQAGVGISASQDPADALREAARSAIDGFAPESVDFALVLASTAYGDRLPELAAVGIDLLGTEAVLGVSVEGVIAGGLEIAGNPAVAVLALSGYEAIPFLIADLAGDEAAAGAELAALFRGSLDQDDLVVLLPDPVSIRPTPLLAGAAECLAPARVVGGAAGVVGGGASVAWLGDRVSRGALAGFALRCGASAHVAVTQACHPVTQPLEVTNSRGNWIYSLEGRPALDVYREAALGPLAADLDRASRFLMVSLASGKPESGGEHCSARSDFTVRHIVGFDRARGAFSLPQPVPSGAFLWFSLLDPDTARNDLGAILDSGPSGPGFGFYFNCRARGESLFGVSGLEAGYLQRAYGDSPIIGMSGAFQIAPRPLAHPGFGVSQLLTYAGVLTLLA